MNNSKKLKPGVDYIGVGGGGLIINRKGKTLLLKRTKKARNEAGFWQKPGGTVEFGETVEEMIKRECLEELGVKVRIIKFLGFTDHFIKKSHQHWIAFNYLVEIVRGQPQNLEPDKHDEIRWLSINKLPKKLSQPTKESIEQYLLNTKESD